MHAQVDGALIKMFIPTRDDLMHLDPNLQCLGTLSIVTDGSNLLAPCR